MFFGFAGFLYFYIYCNNYYLVKGCSPSLRSQRLNKSVFGVLPNSSLYACAAECVSYSICKSFNIDVRNRLCELNFAEIMVVAGSNIFESQSDDKNWKYSPISDWKKVPLGPCQTMQCSGGVRRCYVTRDHQTHCGDDLLMSVALDKPVVTSSKFSSHGRVAVDGNRDTAYGHGSCWAASLADTSPWWQLDLLKEYAIVQISIVNRQDIISDRLHDFAVEVYSQDPVQFPSEESKLCFFREEPFRGLQLDINCTVPLIGRFVRIAGKNKLFTKDLIQFCEVDVFVIELTH